MKKLFITLLVLVSVMAMNAQAYAFYWTGNSCIGSDPSFCIEKLKDMIFNHYVNTHDGE
ncbi:MAG: hypothetical protein UR28_C0002G0017 [Candidatus Peregrinibacteria bacterium GW2011_GWF2_33_10]|nr:MAG: hypothetical protein UR28_C0002G0017 [Candidatus Peregrinibacteria bacterium GW2011_GWF2_33_10]